MSYELLTLHLVAVSPGELWVLHVLEENLWELMERGLLISHPSCHQITNHLP